MVSANTLCKNVLNVKNTVIENFNLYFDKNETGIIAPYKNQVKATANQVDGIDVDTVHKFLLCP